MDSSVLVPSVEDEGNSKPDSDAEVIVERYYRFASTTGIAILAPTSSLIISTSCSPPSAALGLGVLSHV